MLRPNLELRLVAGELGNGVPQAFTFELVNISDHDVRVPQPSVDCGSDFYGSIWLLLVFRPPHMADEWAGFGCADDRFDGDPILKRVQKWQLLHPGEVAKQTIGRDHLHYEGKDPGKYDFWADYRPPAIEQDDQKALRDAGIDFPREPLSSQHIIYEKQP